MALAWAHDGARTKGAYKRLPMSDGLHWANMPRLDAFDEEFVHDAARMPGEGRRTLVRRVWSITVIVLGIGTIAALVLAWSRADGRLRLEPQSVGLSPQGPGRDGKDDEIDRLRREADGLRDEIGALTQAQEQAQRQAADTIAALRAAEQDARSQIPPTVYWYSNPQALHLSIAAPPPPDVVPPRRPATPRPRNP
jgi:hypothetical protein